MGWMAGDQFPARARKFLYTTEPRLALKPTNLDHSPASNVEIKNSRAIPPLPHISSCYDASLITHRDNFVFSEVKYVQFCNLFLKSNYDIR
jgi:hypothetical protein